MKKILFPVLVFCALLASGCKTEPNNNNANNVANQNGANINRNIVNENVNPVAPTPDPKNKAVMIVVSADDHTKKISVAPDPIYLSKGATPTLHFMVYDDLDPNLTEVKVEFDPDPTKNPMAGTFNFPTGVGAGTHARSNAQPLKGGVANGPYKYKITVTVAGDPTPIVLDPEVEVGN
jgi:hypothetical protein